MGKKGQNEVWIMWILKSLLAAYVVTGILLMILAMALYKFELTEEAVTAGITAVYILWEAQRLTGEDRAEKIVLAADRKIWYTGGNTDGKEHTYHETCHSLRHPRPAAARGDGISEKC